MQDMETATAPEVDISGMDFAQLSALRGQIDERVREMRETEGPALASGLSSLRQPSA
jgi:hypothetical protein